MYTTTGLVALAATVSTAAATFQGFNYGSTFTTGAAKTSDDFAAEFNNAQGLIGAPGVFNSARLYTSIQAGTSNSPISAIQAAIDTKTSLLLGIWASAGEAAVSNEIQALQTAIQQHGSDLASLVVGISVGSEDLYRISPTGILNKENPGADPVTIVGYIKQVRDAVAGTPLANAPIGHVDTWTAWVNGSNQAVIDASDFIGVDAYPYFETTLANDITNNQALFNAALDATRAAVGGKPVWVTETGFPLSGKSAGQAVPSVENAKTYWDEVGCALFGNVNTWWYTMQDASPDTPNPSFGIVGNPLTTTPLFDLSCKNVVNSSSTSSAPGSSTTASATGSSSLGSSAAGSSTTVVVPTSLAGGSPGAGSGLPGSQSSLETSTVSLVTSAANSSGAQATSTSVGSLSGSGSSTTAGSGSGTNSTGGGAGTGTPPAPTSTPTTVPGNGAGALTGSVAAGFLAVFAAALAL